MKLEVFCLLVSLILLTKIGFAQSIAEERIVHRNILNSIKDDIKEHYYDPSLKGIDIEENARKANDLIKNANSLAELKNIVFGFLLLFNDQHLIFMPPRSSDDIEYGWELRFIGETVFVTKIEEDSDAMKKGVRVGDQIYMIDGFIPNRKDFWKLKYAYEYLNPRTSVNIILVKPSGKTYQVKIDAKITPTYLIDNLTQVDRRKIQIQDETIHSRETKQLIYDKIPGLLVWKLPTFELGEELIEKTIDRAKKGTSLILDLRGNDELSELIWKSRILSNISNEMVQNLRPNQYSIERKDLAIKSLKRFCSNLFGRKIQLGGLRDRKKVTSLETESSGKDFFNGNIVVLIDNETSSVSEIATRILQLEKRAKIIGDVSAGSTMTTKFFSYKVGIGSLMPFAINVTNAEFVASDGNKLENIGVTPDEKILPTALDLLNERDPAMARAAEILGFKLTPEEAGKIFSKPEKK